MTGTKAGPQVGTQNTPRTVGITRILSCLHTHIQAHVTLGSGITAAVHLVKAHNRSTLRKNFHVHRLATSPLALTTSRSYTCSYGNVTGSMVVTFATRTLYTAAVAYREAAAPASSAMRVVATVTTFTQGNPDGAHYIHRVSWTGCVAFIVGN